MLSVLEEELQSREQVIHRVEADLKAKQERVLDPRASLVLPKLTRNAGIQVRIREDVNQQHCEVQTDDIAAWNEDSIREDDIEDEARVIASPRRIRHDAGTQADAPMDPVAYPLEITVIEHESSILHRDAMLTTRAVSTSETQTEEREDVVSRHRRGWTSTNQMVQTTDYSPKRQANAIESMQGGDVRVPPSSPAVDHDPSIGSLKDVTRNASQISVDELHPVLVNKYERIDMTNVDTSGSVIAAKTTNTETGTHTDLTTKSQRSQASVMTARATTQTAEKTHMSRASGPDDVRITLI